MVRVPVNKGDHRIWAHNQVCLGAQTLMPHSSSARIRFLSYGGFDEARIKDILKLPKQAEITMMMALGNRKPEGLYGPRLRLPKRKSLRSLDYKLTARMHIPHSIQKALPAGSGALLQPSFDCGKVSYKIVRL